MTPQAYDFAAAESALSAASNTAEKATTELNALQSRLLEKQQALNMIQQRRLDGGELESDGSTIHLLMLDIAGLEPLVASAQARQQAACEEQQATQMAVQHCQQALERATALEAAQALESRLHELESLLLFRHCRLGYFEEKGDRVAARPWRNALSIQRPAEKILAAGCIAVKPILARAYCVRKFEQRSFSTE